MRFSLLGLWLLLLLPFGANSEYAASQTKTLIGIDAVEATAIAELADEIDDEKDSGDSVISHYVVAIVFNCNAYSFHTDPPNLQCSGGNTIRAPPGSFLS